MLLLFIACSEPLNLEGNVIDVFGSPVSNAEVFHFTQLPLVWKFPVFKIFCELVRKLPIPYSPQNDVSFPLKLNKFIRFSNEIMLLGTGVK